MKRVTIEELLAHQGFVHKLAYSLTGNLSVTEDVVQEVWLTSLCHPPIDQSPKAWLATVVRNLVYRQHRGRGRAERRETLVAKPEATESTFDIVARNSMKQEIGAAFESLPDAQRTALILRLHDELKPSEISELLDAPVATVKTRLQRGLTQLRKDLDSHYGKRENWAPTLLLIAQNGFQATRLGSTLVPKSTFSLLASPWLLGLGALLLLGLAIWWGITPILEGGLRRLERDPSAEAHDRKTASVSSLPIPEPREPDGPVPHRRERAPAEDRAVRLRPEWEGGQPLQNARIVPSVSGQAMADLEVGPDGFVDWHLPGDRALDDVTFYTILESGYPSRCESTSEDGELRLVLPRRSGVSGTVLIDGEPPTEPIEVKLDSTLGLADRGLFPPKVWEHLVDDLPGVRTLVTWTDSEGIFAFPPVLEADWLGALRFDDAFEILEPWQQSSARRAKHRIDLYEPKENVRIELRRRVLVKGRLTTDRGESVSGAEGWLVSSETGEVLATVRTNEGGQFSATVSNETSGQVRLQLVQREAGARAWATRSFDGSDPEQDFGTLVLGASRTVRVVVSDREGHPIEGAIAGDADGASLLSAPTNEHGVTELDRIPADASLLIVAAPGFETRLVATPRSDAPLAVQLEPRGELELRISDRDGRPAPGVRVLVSEPVRPAAQYRAFADVERAFGRSVPVSDRDRDVAYVSDLEGLLRVSAAPGGWMRVRAESHGEWLLDESFLAPLAGEKRTEEIRLPRRRHDLRGLVLDSKGRAIAGAIVSIEWNAPEVAPLAGLTDASGRFLIPDLYLEQARLRVQCTGFHPVLQENVPHSDEDWSIELSRGKTVTIAVVDVDGDALDVDRVHYTVGPRRRLLKRTGLGVAQFTNCPPGPVVVGVIYQRRTYDVELDASYRDSVTLTLALGSLEVLWDREGLEPGPWNVRLTSDDPSRRPIVVPLSGDDLAAGRARIDRVQVGRWHVSIVRDRGETAVLGPMEGDVSAKEVTRVRF